MPDQSYHHKRFGVISIRRNARIKRISIRISADASIRLSYPLNVSQDQALDFLEKKACWIEEALQKMRHKNIQRTLQIGTKIHLATKPLLLVCSTDDTISINPKEEQIELAIPTGFSLDCPKNQEFVKKNIIEILRHEAKKFLPPRVEMLAHKHQLPFSQLRIKNLQSIWGSCSYQDNINLNLHLIRLPLHLIDYIILHELCHTKERNHSIQFWNLLNQKLGQDAKLLSKELIHYSPLI